MCDVTYKSPDLKLSSWSTISRLNHTPSLQGLTRAVEMLDILVSRILNSWCLFIHRSYRLSLAEVLTGVELDD